MSEMHFFKNVVILIQTFLSFALSRKITPLYWWCPFSTLLGFSAWTQPAITCSKFTVETFEQRVKYVQSYQ